MKTELKVVQIQLSVLELHGESSNKLHHDLVYTELATGYCTLSLVEKHNAIINSK